MEVRAKKKIQAPADKVWKTISKFDGIDKYLPMVAKCQVEGSGVGAKRICTLQDGVKLFERLEAVDDATKTLKYSITESPLPISGYLGTVQVKDLGQGSCEVDWSSIFENKGMPESEIKGLLTQAFASGIEGLEKLHRTK